MAAHLSSHSLSAISSFSVQHVKISPNRSMSSLFSFCSQFPFTICYYCLCTTKSEYCAQSCGLLADFLNLSKSEEIPIQIAWNSFFNSIIDFSEHLSSLLSLVISSWWIFIWLCICHKTKYIILNSLDFFGFCFRC